MPDVWGTVQHGLEASILMGTQQELRIQIIKYAKKINYYQNLSQSFLTRSMINNKFDS